MTTTENEVRPSRAERRRREARAKRMIGYYESGFVDRAVQVGHFVRYNKYAPHIGAKQRGKALA